MMSMIRLLALLLCFALTTEAQFGSRESSSPLIRALVKNDVKLANKLLDEGADASFHEVVTPLYVAQQHVKNGKERHAMLRRLIALGAKAGQGTEDGSTPLILAALEGDAGSVQILLEHGAAPLDENEQGYNAIMAAEHGDHMDVVSMLQNHVKSKRVAPKEEV